MRINIDCDKFEGDGEQESVDSEAEFFLEAEEKQIGIEIGDNAYFFDKKEILIAVKALCEEKK